MIYIHIILIKIIYYFILTTRKKREVVFLLIKCAYLHCLALVITFVRNKRKNNSHRSATLRIFSRTLEIYQISTMRE